MINKYNAFIAMGIVAVATIGLTINHVGNAPEKTEQLLSTKYNLHDINVGGYNYWCAKGTLVRRNFEAKNEKNEQVEGSVCAGRLFLSDDVEIKRKPKI
jgi:hypothetical protein